MSNSPFSKPPIPVFNGILGKIQMALTIKAIIESKKDFVESTKNAIKIKATQKANELKDKAIKEARERGQTAASNLKKKRDEASARAASTRATAASKTAALTSTPTTAITSARSIPEAIDESPELKQLRQQRAKLVESIATVEEEYQQRKKEFDEAKNAALKGIYTAEYQTTLLPAFVAAVRKLTPLEVQLRELNAKLVDIDTQIEAEISKITG
jgi:hypothetical protein